MKYAKTIIYSTLFSCTLTSCMINTHMVGNGGTGKQSTREKSFYIIGNRIKEADTKRMANGATDYSIDTRTNFVDMLINGVTFGILQTRTVTVKK